MWWTVAGQCFLHRTRQGQVEQDKPLSDTNLRNIEREKIYFGEVA